MHSDFLRFKHLVGELKWSHTGSHLSMSVTTEEIVIQKPHMTYHILLSHLVGLIPYDASKGKRTISLHAEKQTRTEVVEVQAGGSGLYKLDVTQGTMLNRSGVFRFGRTSIVVPICRELVRAIVQYAGFSGIGPKSEPE